LEAEPCKPVGYETLGALLITHQRALAHQCLGELHDLVPPGRDGRAQAVEGAVIRRQRRNLLSAVLIASVGTSL
jgi:hypothetical protein